MKQERKNLNGEREAISKYFSGSKGGTRDIATTRSCYKRICLVFSGRHRGQD